MDLFYILLGVILIFAAGGIGYWIGILKYSIILYTQKEESENKRMDLEKRNVILETEFKNLNSRFEQNKKDYTESKNELMESFKNIASRVLSENSQNWNQTSFSTFESFLKPFKENLDRWEKKFTDEGNRHREESISLKILVEQLTGINRTLSEDAKNLTNALKGESKVRGNWGELVLERLLESSGLIKGIHFFLQGTYKREDGNLFRPDVIIKLPGEREIIIDSKVSLVAYEAYINSNDDIDRKRFLKEHINSLEKHVKELSNKSYQTLPGIASADFVFLFVPIEGALNSFFLEKENAYSFMVGNNIIPVSPSNLLLSLRLTNYLWKLENQNNNTKEIAKLAGQLYDKFADFLKDYSNLGNTMDSAKKHYELAEKKLSTGNGNILDRAKELKTMGAETSKLLPEKFNTPTKADNNELFIEQ